MTFDCRVFGTSGPDRLHGTSRQKTDVIYGLAGNDQIRADGGDVVYGGSGNDTIRARNREFDEIWCGPGTDRVFTDRIDKVAPDCETVHR